MTLVPGIGVWKVALLGFATVRNSVEACSDVHFLCACVVDRNDQLYYVYHGIHIFQLAIENSTTLYSTANLLDQT